MGILLAVDPGMVRVGYAVLDNNTVVASGEFKNKGADDGLRLRYLYGRLYDIIDEYNVDFVVLEQGFSRYNTATRKLAKVEGVIQLLAVGKGIYSGVLSNSIVKKWVREKLDITGKVCKETTAKAVLSVTNIRAGGPDESDAIALGLAFLEGGFYE